MITDAEITAVSSPRAIIVGGANGSGKTTLAGQLLLLEPAPMLFLNADEIQRLAPAASHPIAAGKELLRQLEQAVSNRTPFVVETTLSSKSYAQAAPAWKRAGYTVVLHFIELPNADFAVERVRRRVAAGGHGIPEADIRRRFARGIVNFSEHYRNVADEWYHWWSDNNGIRLLSAS